MLLYEFPELNILTQIVHFPSCGFEHRNNQVLSMSWMSPWATPITSFPFAFTLSNFRCGLRIFKPAYRTSEHNRSPGTKYSCRAYKSPLLHGSIMDSLDNFIFLLKFHTLFLHLSGIFRSGKPFRATTPTGLHRP